MSVRSLGIFFPARAVALEPGYPVVSYGIAGGRGSSAGKRSGRKAVSLSLETCPTGTAVPVAVGPFWQRQPVGEKLWQSHAVLSGGGFAGFGAGHVAGKMDRKHLPAGRSAHCVRGKSYHGGALPASVCIYAHFRRLWGAGHRRQPESVEAMGDPGRFCTPGAFLSVAAPAPGKRGLAENSLWPAASGTGALVTAVGGKGHRRPGYWLVPDQIPVYF